MHELPRNLSPDAQEVLALAALDGHLDLIVDLVGVNFFGHVGGGPPGTLLHHAAWAGNADAVRELLARDADPAARSGAEFDTPLAWAVHGSRYNRDGGDYVGVAKQLVAAGAELDARWVDAAEGELARWLEERDADRPTN